MPRLTLALAFLLVAPILLAGCLNDEPAATQAQTVAASAEEAGMVSGPAPVAAKDAYQVQTTSESGAPTAATAYPVAIQTNPARAPYHEEFTGTYEPQECAPTGGGLPLGGLGLARGSQFFDLTDVFSQNDVFSYDVALTWTNTERSWGDLHLWHQFDGVGNYWNEPTNEPGEKVINFTGQGFIVRDEFFAGVGVECWYGFVTQPIPFTISVTVTFAEGAVPAQVPVLLKVPDGATRLFATGVPLDASKPVLSHYRVFAPDDSLVCECAIASDAQTSALELPGTGDYVVLVDHTENGFVALALDVDSDDKLLPLETQFAAYPLASSAGGNALDETLSVDIPSTPLQMWAWVFAPGPVDGAPDLGAGKNLKITVTNGRGEVVRTSMAGYLTFHAAVPGVFITNDYYAVPVDGDWEFFVDHHAYDLGAHTVRVQAEALRGEARLMALHYVRPA